MKDRHPVLATTYKFAHSKVANSKRQPIVFIRSQFQTNTTKLMPTMKNWVYMLLAIGVSLGIVMVLLAICFCIEWCCPSGDEQVDEENPGVYISLEKLGKPSGGEVPGFRTSSTGR
jgi:hypothetical protein